MTLFFNKSFVGNIIKLTYKFQVIHNFHGHKKDNKLKKGNE